MPAGPRASASAAGFARREPAAGRSPTARAGRGFAPVPRRAEAVRAVRCAWYVDPVAHGADTGSSWANAWNSLSAIRWYAVHPGDVVCLSGGRRSQTYTGTITLGRSGTRTRPITITAARDRGHAGRVVFDYGAGGDHNTRTAISLNGQDDITISGFAINNLYNIASGTTSAAIYGSGDTGITVTHMSFTNDNNPVHITSGIANTVSDSAFHRTRGDAAIALSGSRGGFDSTQVYGNYIETVCQQGGRCDQGGDGATYDDGPDGVQNGSGVSIHDNTFKELVLAEPTSGQHPDMIQNQGNYTKVYDNDFENVGDSNFDYDGFAAGGSVHDIWIYDNVFRILTPIDPYPDFIRIYSSGTPVTSITNVRIMNNLFADSDRGGGIPPVNICYYRGCAAGGGGTGSSLTNNIFVNDGDGSPAGPMLAVEASAGSGWTARSNVYYRAGGGYVTWEGTTFTARSFVSQVDRTGRTGPPAFRRYSPHSASNDFRLAPSDTVDMHAGVNLSGYFTRDRDGIVRPRHGAWSVGPYQR